MLRSIISANRADRRVARGPVIAACLLALVLLVLAFAGADWSKMVATLRRGQPIYLGFALLTLVVSLSLRGLRWRVLLSAERRLPPLLVVQATAVGYLGNSFLPARAGEVIRSVLLARLARISTGYVLATALTERIVDALALVCISMLSLLALHTAPGWLLSAARVVSVVGFGGLIAMVAIPRLVPMLTRRLSHLLPSGTHMGRLRALLAGFLLGMRALQHPGRAAGFLVLTGMIWLVDALVATEVARAFHFGLSLPQVLLLLAALGLASAAPSTPGYVGIYQFVAVSVLPSFGLTRTDALVYILAYQAVIYAVVTTIGILSAWHLARLLGSSAPIPATSVLV